MDFSLSEEQQTGRQDHARVRGKRTLSAYEAEVESSGVLRDELQKMLKAKAIEAGLYAANMPAEVGGAGLDYRDLGTL